MQDNKRNHPTRQHARPAESPVNGNRDSGQPEQKGTAAESDIVSDLSQYRLIPVQGEDAEDFLHDQLTVACRNWNNGQSRLAAWCNPKGRALALFRVFRHGGDYHQRVPAPLAPLVRKRRSMFILRSKVRLGESAEQPVYIGASGPNVAER